MLIQDVRFIQQSRKNLNMVNQFYSKSINILYP